MHDLNPPGRRAFLRAGATLGAVACAPLAVASTTAASRQADTCSKAIGTMDLPVITKVRTLGTGDARLEVSALGFGVMGMNYNRGVHPDRQAMIELLHQAVDRGVTLFDTAQVYGPLINEALAGEALHPFRNKVSVTTKFGHRIVDGKYLDGELDSSPENIRRVAEESLKRLRVEAIDLFYQHRADPAVPIEEVAGAGLANRVIQARFDGSTWRETRVLLAGIPGHRLYNGGRIAVGPDGCLYVTTGWTEDRALPQDLRSLAGRVLRLTLDGRVPADNPFPNSPVYSYGHRNPQGLAWSPSGRLYVIEHGQSGHDEVNLINPGANYGWPLAQGRETHSGTEPAWVESGRDTWAPSGAAFAGNVLLVAALGARGLYAFDDAAMALKPVFSSGDRLRDVLPNEKNIYVITSNRSPRSDGPSKDRLLKLTLKH